MAKTIETDYEQLFYDLAILQMAFYWGQENGRLSQPATCVDTVEEFAATAWPDIGA